MQRRASWIGLSLSRVTSGVSGRWLGPASIYCLSCHGNSLPDPGCLSGLTQVTSGEGRARRVRRRPPRGTPRRLGAHPRPPGVPRPSRVHPERPKVGPTRLVTRLAGCRASWWTAPAPITGRSHPKKNIFSTGCIL